MRASKQLIPHTIIHGLEIIHQGQDILMAHGDSLKHRDLISDLDAGLLSAWIAMQKQCWWAGCYHVLSPSHQPFVNHFGRIIPTGVNVHTFLHHRIGASPKSLASFVSAWLDLRPLAILRL